MWNKKWQNFRNKLPTSKTMQCFSAEGFRSWNEFLTSIWKSLLTIFLVTNSISSVYARGGQSAALQRFSAAPVSNFGCASKLFMTHLCIKYPKFTSIMWSLCKKNEAKKFLRPAIQYFNEIWPVRKKVWPPLLYSNDGATTLIPPGRRVERDQTGGVSLVLA